MSENFADLDHLKTMRFGQVQEIERKGNGMVRARRVSHGWLFEYSRRVSETTWTIEAVVFVSEYPPVDLGAIENHLSNISENQLRK